MCLASDFQDMQDQALLSQASLVKLEKRKTTKKQSAALHQRAAAQQRTRSTARDEETVHQQELAGFRAS
jgi:hypothetical protein